MLKSYARKLKKHVVKLKRNIANYHFPKSHINRVTTIRQDRNNILSLVPGRQVEIGVDQQRSFLNLQRAVPVANNSFYSEETYLGLLDQVQVDLSTGIILDQNQDVVIESAKNLSRLENSKTWKDKKIKSKCLLNGYYSSIHSPYNANYFHWLVEALPRLYSLSKYNGQVCLLMPENENEFHQKTLGWCLPDNVTVQTYPDRWALVEHFVFPSYLTTLWDFAFPPREHLDFISKRIINCVDISEARDKENLILISRSKARTRRLVNEDEVAQCAMNYGFKKYILEEMKFDEQVKLFYNARIIIGLHGAGFTNMLFAQDAKILEITSVAVTPVYFFLSLVLNHDYHFILPEEYRLHSQRSTADKKKYSEQRDEDVTVDMVQFETVIQALIKD